MSKRDIETVCTLAAHLAQRQRQVETGIGCFDEYIKKPAECAADAMTLQRLGRSARNADKWCMRRAPRWIVTYEAACMRIVREADEILKPYGLCAQVFDAGICIIGLPGNTGGGEQEGFSI